MALTYLFYLKRGNNLLLYSSICLILDVINLMLLMSMKIYDFYKVISTCVLWGTGEKMAGILAEIDLWKLGAEIHRFPRIII